MFRLSDSDLSHLSYFDRLRRLVVLGWTTLETRRIYADLVLCFKILNGLVSTEISKIFTINNSSIITRGHKFKLTVRHSHCNLRHNFFAIRVVPIWNELPAHVVEAGSVYMFKF